MNLLVDLDGVIVEYDFPKLVKEHFGVDIGKLSIYAHDLADVLGVSPEEIDEMFLKQVHGKPNFIEGSIETLYDLTNKGHIIIIHSNRIKYMGLTNLINWLLKNKIHYHALYSLCPNGDIIYDYFIDDYPGKLQSVKVKHKLLFNHPWNEGCLNIKNELQRVYSWNEIRNIIGGNG